MTDPVFLIAITGLGLSGLVSAIRLIDWFLHTDPKAIVQTGRWAAIGLFALSLPLLFGLVIEHEWTAAIGLSAVLLFAFALYGPRYLSRLSRRRLMPDLSMPGAGYSGADAAAGDAETVHRAIAVLEDYLRHAGSNSKFESHGTHLQADRSAVPRARGQRGGNGHDDVHGALPMPDAEALQVLGLRAGATESEINESHRRLMQLIHPDRGGSAYFAVKVNQAKDVLLGRGQSLQDRGASAGTRKRRRAASQQDFSQSKPTTGG
jgi:hypothetical protein